MSAEEFLAFEDAWRSNEGMLLSTSDGSSAFERAKEWHAGMMGRTNGKGYRMTDKVSAVPDYFPFLTDVLEDGLRYEMGFTLLVNGTDAGRIGRYTLELPNRAVFYTDDMVVKVRLKDLFVGRRRDERRGQGQEEAVLHMEHVQEEDPEP